MWWHEEPPAGGGGHLLESRRNTQHSILYLNSTRSCAAFGVETRWGCGVQSGRYDPDMGRLRAVFTSQRQVRGQTFDDLAAASGLSRQTLLNLSAGRYNGDLRTWAILARTWEVALDELIAPIWD
jgi:DNA-binding XRE family transcriptional regulator